MTVINDIEIDNIQYNFNNIKRSILNNSPIEDKLHVVIVISNPCLFAKRYILIKEFIKRFEMEETDVILYVVELAYGNQNFIITDKNCKNHLQLRTEIPIWHKENMINLGIKKLLPKNWKAVAWIDADIEFDNVTWAKDALKLLGGSYDIIQLFTHCVDMDIDGNNMNIFTSFGERYIKGIPWHPGYAWACTRNAYDKMGGLYENAILGSGDHIMAMSLIGRGINSINNLSSDDYKNNILEFEKKVKNFRIGTVPGIIRHHFHGSKKNRKYSERWQILIKYNFSPLKDLIKDENGLLMPSKDCSNCMISDIYNYFKERNEDEFLHEKIRMSSKYIKIDNKIKSTINDISDSISNKENIDNNNNYTSYVSPVEATSVEYLNIQSTIIDDTYTSFLTPNEATSNEYNNIQSIINDDTYNIVSYPTIIHPSNQEFTDIFDYQNECQLEINPQYVESNIKLSNSIDTSISKNNNHLSFENIDNFGIPSNMMYNSKNNITFTSLINKNEYIAKPNIQRLDSQTRTNESNNNKNMSIIKSKSLNSPILVKSQQSPNSKNLIIKQHNNPSNIISIQRIVDNVNTPTKHKGHFFINNDQKQSPHIIKNSTQNIQKPQSKQMTQQLKQLKPYTPPQRIYKPPIIIDEAPSKSIFSKLFDTFKS